MSNVRFVKSSNNKARKSSETATWPRLMNGSPSFPGSPSVTEDAAFPMLNALFADRVSRVWIHPANAPNAGNDTVFEIEVSNAPQNIVGGGLLGLSYVGSSFPTLLGIEYIPGGTYNAALWTASGIPTLNIGPPTRDHGVFFPAISARWWRFRFFNTNISPGFILASFFLTTSPTDLGFLYSRADETLIVPKSMVEGYGHSLVVTRTGIPYRRWVLQYDNNDTTTRNEFDALMSETFPFVFLTPDDKVFECVPDGEDFTRSHIWSPPDRWSFVFPLRSLP